MRGKLKAEPNDVVCKYLTEASIKSESQHSFYNMSRINLAHVIMLKKQDIIPEEDANIIIKELLSLREKGADSFEIDLKLEDYYMNMEHYLINQIGMDVAGKLHTARSRNDLNCTLIRMNVRDSWIKISNSLIELRITLIKLAEEHKETIITGYTHMQPAQPITLGHYFIAIAEALERDQQRLNNAYRNLNLSSLGSCAFAGTSFLIDREYTASLLGFDGIVENSIDAVASRDYLMELVANYTIIGSTLSRLATDLYYWATDEFNYVEVDDSLAVTSSIMPQKKNPITLEHVKAKSSHLLASFVSIVTSLKSTPFGHNREISSETLHGYWDADSQLEAMISLLNKTIQLIKIKKGKLKERADTNFCTVTELADEMVKREGISFREAHHIAGAIMIELAEDGMTTRDVTVELLRDASEKTIGRPINWTQSIINQTLDSANSIKNRCSQGAPSPTQCSSMINSLNVVLLKDKKTLENKLELLKKADEKLNLAANEVTSLA